MIATQAALSTLPERGNSQQLIDGVHEIMRSVLRSLQPALESEGISIGQFWALHLVSSLPSASPSAVARYLAVSPPTVCANVDQLEAAGFLVRHRSRTDRRAVDLSLTPKGQRVEARIWKRIERLITDASRDLAPEDLGATIRVFRELNRRLSPNSPGGPEGS